MRYSIAVLLMAAGCTTDIIDHSSPDTGVGDVDSGTSLGMDAGLVGVDASLDAGAATDATVAQDAGTRACKISVSGDYDFGTISQGPVTQAQTLTNTGSGPCEVLWIAVRDPLQFEVVTPNQGALLIPGDALQITVRPLEQLGHLETELIVNLSEGQQMWELNVPIRALRQADELPSTVTVTLRVSNATAQDRWVHTAGWSCTPYSLGVPLDIEFQCGCECPAPPEPQVSQLARVPAGGEIYLAWDGREAVTWIQRIDCGPDQMQELRMAKQPAAGGAYDVRLGVESTLPANCNLSGDFADCTPDTSGQVGVSGGVADKCLSMQTVTNSFVLVQGQNQLVPLTITN